MPQPSMPVVMRGRARRANAAADRLADRGLRRVVVLPVRLELPAAELGEQDEHRVLARAHVAQGRRPLAVAREPRRPSGRRAASPRCRTRARDCGIPSRRNSAWTVRTWTSSPEWLDVMSASSSPVRSNSRRPPARSRAISPNGFIAERRLTIRSGSPSRWSIRPAASTSTMSPRWTDSTIPLRTWRTRTGGTDHFALRAGPRHARPARDADADREADRTAMDSEHSARDASRR